LDALRRHQRNGRTSRTVSHILSVSYLVLSVFPVFSVLSRYRTHMVKHCHARLSTVTHVEHCHARLSTIHTRYTRTRAAYRIPAPPLRLRQKISQKKKRRTTMLTDPQTKLGAPPYIRGAIDLPGPRPRAAPVVRALRRRLPCERGRHVALLCTRTRTPAAESRTAVHSEHSRAEQSRCRDPSPLPNCR
jgi:hypothetical protein